MAKIRAYTDGACSGNPGPGGWAGVILFPEGNQEIVGSEINTTNNRMELRGVVEILKLALDLGYERIAVYTDSAYVVNAIKKEWLKKWRHNGWKTIGMQDVKNRDLWEKLHELMKQFSSADVIKVKGHSDNEWNNRCDKLARKEVEKIKASRKA